MKYGGIKYVYSAMNKNNTNNMVVISDLSEGFVDDYLRNKKQNIDPIIINALDGVDPFRWDKIYSQWAEKVFSLR